MTRMFYVTRIGPCGAATGLDIGLGNMSMKFISLTFYSENYFASSVRKSQLTSSCSNVQILFPGLRSLLRFPFPSRNSNFQTYSHHRYNDSRRHHDGSW